MVLPRTLLGSTALRGRLAAIVRDVGGQRAFSRLTGIPRSTLQDFLSGRVQQPTSATLAYMDQTVQLTRGRTFVFESMEFDSDSLRRIEPPEGSDSFRLVSERMASPGREFGSSEWISLDLETPDQAAAGLGLDPAAVTRVVFNRPR